MAMTSTKAFSGKELEDPEKPVKRFNTFNTFSNEDFMLTMHTDAFSYIGSAAVPEIFFPML